MNALHSSDEHIAHYVMGSLVGDEAQQLETHIASCAACAEKLHEEALLEEQLFAVSQATKNVVPRETPVQWRPAAAAALRQLEEEPAPAPAPATVTVAPTSDVEWHYPNATKKQHAPRWPWVVLAASVALLALAVGLVIGMQKSRQEQALIAAVTPPVATPPVAPQAQVAAQPPAPPGAIAVEPPRQAAQVSKGRNKAQNKEKPLLAAAEPK